VNGIPRRGQPDDFVAGIKLIHRFTPAGRGKFNGQIVGANEIERVAMIDSILPARPVTVNPDQIDVDQAIRSNEKYTKVRN